MKENVIRDKSYAFALLIIKVYKKLAAEKEFVLSKQLLRSGTSIGANIEEATGAISKKEYVAKLQISYKEARETLFWINLLYDSEYLEKSDAEILKTACEELIRIIAAILKSSKK
ncbi:MAG: four helix bundle protein [Bacteroidales bacterium]|nr:four helix bundle protein [Bacteroidales bacterium]